MLLLILKVTLSSEKIAEMSHSFGSEGATRGLETYLDQFHRVHIFHHDKYLNVQI